MKNTKTSLPPPGIFFFQEREKNKKQKKKREREREREKRKTNSSSCFFSVISFVLNRFFEATFILLTNNSRNLIFSLFFHTHFSPTKSFSNPLFFIRKLFFFVFSVSSFSVGKMSSSQAPFVYLQRRETFSSSHRFSSFHKNVL